MAANGYQASPSDLQLNRVAGRAGSLTLNQWQIWVVLALTVACACMSLTLHRMTAEERAMAGTLQQVERLKHIGCDFVQGYYFAKPLSAADFADFLQSWDACSEAG